MNHNSTLCHGLVLYKPKGSIPFSALLPILVNLGLWLTEQKLIRSYGLFVYPPARTTESEVTLHTLPHTLYSLNLLLMEKEQYLSESFQIM